MINLGPAVFSVQVACVQKNHQTCHICHKQRRVMANVFVPDDEEPHRGTFYERLQICRFCLGEMSAAINFVAKQVRRTATKSQDKTPEECQDVTSEPTGCAAADKESPEVKETRDDMAAEGRAIIPDGGFDPANAPQTPLSPPSIELVQASFNEVAKTPPGTMLDAALNIVDELYPQQTPPGTVEGTAEESG